MEPRPTAVLFVDICGSTAYFDRRGEEAGRAMVERSFRVVVPEIERRGGRVVKFMGDGLLAVFESAADLVVAVRAAHTALAAASASLPPPERHALHSGGHFGPVFHDPSGDVFGDVVNVAARVQGIAGRDQIYVTADLVRELPDAERGSVRRIGTFPVRGKEEEIEVHEVMWRTGTSTIVVSRAAFRPEAHLSLSFGGRTFELLPDQKRVTLGRTEGNDLVVEDAAVSREHAEVVHRKGFFQLVDRSTNGTWLRPDGAPSHHVHHDEFPLEGSGTFSLGHPDGPPIEYRVSVEIHGG